MSTERVHDWLNLPADVTTTSLSSMLHDGLLTSALFHAPSRRAEFVVQVGHVAAFHRLPADTRWRIELLEVESLRVAQWHDLPGSRHGGKPNGFEESVRFEEFAARVLTSRCALIEADVALTAEGVALRFDFGIDSPYTYGLCVVRAAQIAVFRGEQPLELVEFVEQGDAYWRAWSAKQAKLSGR